MIYCAVGEGRRPSFPPFFISLANIQIFLSSFAFDFAHVTILLLDKIYLETSIWLKLDWSLPFAHFTWSILKYFDLITTLTIITVLHAKTYIQVIYQLMFKCPEVIEKISRNSLTFILPSHDYWMFVKEVQYLVQCFITVLLSSFITKFFYYKLGTDSMENFILEWNGVPGIKKEFTGELQSEM